MTRTGVIKSSQGDIPFVCSCQMDEWRERVQALPPAERENVIDRLTNEWRKAIVLELTRWTTTSR